MYPALIQLATNNSSDGNSHRVLQVVAPTTDRCCCCGGGATAPGPSPLLDDFHRSQQFATLTAGTERRVVLEGREGELVKAGRRRRDQKGGRKWGGGQGE